MKNYITKYLILFMGIIITSFSVASNDNFTFPTKKQKKLPEKNSSFSNSSTLTDDSHFDDVDNWLEEDEELKKEIEKEQKEREESSKQHGKLKNTAEHWFLGDEELLKEYGFFSTQSSPKKSAPIAGSPSGKGNIGTVATNNTKTTQTKVKK